MRFVKKVNERGVLTLPAEVREALGVDEGDIVEFEVLNVIKKKGGNAEPQTIRTEVHDEPHDAHSHGGTAL